MYYILTLILAYILTLILLPIVIKFTNKYKIYDQPDSNIKTHKIPTPYLGGIAIALSFFITLLVIRFSTDFDTGTLRNLRGIYISGFILLLVGVYDDLKDMNFKMKFFWQFLAATVLIFFDMKIKFITPNYMAIFFTYLWIIGIINAVNLVDIMDGLSSGIALIACLSFFFINSPMEASYVNFAAIALGGACLGFLPYNFHHARIFMGDAGSMFIGLVLAAISLGTNYSSNNSIGVLAPIFILAIPIYDTCYIIIKRLEKGQSIFLGSKDHVALRLNISGWSIKKTVLILYLVGVLLAIAAYLITEANLKNAIIYALVVLVFAVLVGFKIGEIEVD
ncbi:MAG: undecaprenyl/decaprenyl-phosphate alpha-N-acetylglucosaminyl 1-phosphate transferase [bacterium]|nr:undecaprenyl/decaprenyl-phosphate alpha-N-acetylglucosaminyl 1-phosphate transferase [bacterium]